MQPECEVNLTTYDGILCNSEVQVRRVAIWNQKPEDIFYNMELKVLKVDESLLNSMDPITLNNYFDNKSSYSVIPFKTRSNPNNGWAVPFVTNHKYKLHWRFGLDFT